MRPRWLDKIDDKKKLRLVLVLFLLALAVPTGAVLWQAYGQLKWEAFHQHREQAEALAERINRTLASNMRTAEAYGLAEYSFLNITGDPQAGFLQRSPLSSYPVEEIVPGLIGYFQVDARGQFSSPLLPGEDASAASLGISEMEFRDRQQLASRIRDILAAQQLALEADSARAHDSQELFDELSQGGRKNKLADAGSSTPAPESAPLQNRAADYRKIDELRLDDRLQKKSEVAEDASREDREHKDSAELEMDHDLESVSAPSEPARSRRVEQAVLPEVQSELSEEEALSADMLAAPGEVRITTFVSEVEPFELALLDSGELVFYRNVWREDVRLIQGFLVDQDRFVEEAIIAPFQTDRLSAVTDLAIGLGDYVIRMSRAAGDEQYLAAQAEMKGDLLYRSRLISPLDEMELIFSVSSLPAGPGGRVLALTSVLLVLVFGAGFAALYRLGLGQIRLARQQQDFVAAVSHELKTPLTSIRMYSEMLKEGWTDDGKRQQYYEFIHDESERLSRLIANVLQLASITRNEPSFDLRPITAAHLLDTVRSRIARQVESAGFELEIDSDADADHATVELDEDCIMQIIINLVDNAIKFSRDGDLKRLVIRARVQNDSGIRFSVRDFGPGIPRDQIRKIFRLFYRPESELTRETVGTGIGLAIVHQLTVAMGGSVDVLNRDPGAEFGITFPVVQ